MSEEVQGTPAPGEPGAAGADPNLTDAQNMDDQERAKTPGLEPIDRDNPEEPTPPKEPDEGDGEAQPAG
jgi:hypothetical protein